MTLGFVSINAVYADGLTINLKGWGELFEKKEE
jgi:hypothetical protein